MIRYFERATSKQFETCCHKNIAEFLKAKNFNREELLRMRFFKGDVLGDEVDTSDISFLHEEEGEFEIFSGIDMPLGPVLPFVPYIVGALFFVAAIVLAPSIPNVNVSDSSSSSSSTNKLGSTSNEANVNGRIDDIFGTVNYHTPPLWQVPYRIGVNNQETEVLLVCVGRGKYDINTSEVFDSYTPYTAIPLAQASIYEPGTYPGNGSPSQSVRGTVDQPIGVYRESTDLNASELLPPNDLDIGGDAVWSLEVVDGDAVFTLTNGDEIDVDDLGEYFTAGTDVTLIDVFMRNVVGNVTLHRDIDDPDNPLEFDDDPYTFESIELGDDLSGDYVISSVLDLTISIDGTAWVDFSGYLMTTYYSVTDDNAVVQFYTDDTEIFDAGENNQWWFNSDGTSGGTDPAYYYETTVIDPDLGQVFDNTTGPVAIYSGATSVIVNLTSASGYYKLKSNNAVSISANVQIVVEELDDDGIVTGNSFEEIVVYTSNSSSLTKSVYQSVYIDIPYDNSRIRARRTTDRDKSSAVSNVDKIEWTALYSFEPIPDGTDFGDVTLMHCVIPSNSQSRIIKSRKTNLHVTRKITEYLGDGEFGSTESYATDSAVQIMIHTALDPKIGRLTLPKINADGLLDLETEINEYYGSTDMVKFGYDFDTTQMSYEDMFMLIANVIGCYPYTQNGVYDAFFEKPQTSSSLQVTCRNKIADSETREDIFYKQYDGVELTYRNNETGVSEVIYIPDDLSASNAETIEMLGCTTELQAYRRALRARNKQIYKMFNVEFDVDEFGRLIVPGSRIDSPDGTRFVRHQGNTQGYNIYQGEVVEVNGLVVELSEPVAFVDGEDHYIQFTNLTGENSELIMCTQGDDEYEIVLAETPVESIYDGYSRDKTKFTFCSEQLRESIALIPQTISSKMDGATETNTISSINYDSRYYKDDMETPS